jgi:glutathione S-transferase
MKLYDFTHAPNPRKVRVYLAEKGLVLPLVPVDLTTGANRTPEFLAKNPMGSVPVLELDDGSYLTESLAIVQYLEELHPDPPMIGTTPLERARVRELERMIEMSLLSRIARVFLHTSPMFPRAGQISEIAGQARRQLPGALRIVDAAVGTRAFAAGERPTIADCTLLAAWEYARLAGVEIGAEHRNLQRWYRDFSARPSAKA